MLRKWTILAGFAATFAVGPAQAQSVTITDLITNLNQNCGPSSTCLTAVEVSLGWDSTLRNRDQTDLGEFLCNVAERNPAYARRIADLVESLGTTAVDRAFFRNCGETLDVVAGDVQVVNPPGGNDPPPGSDDPPPGSDSDPGNGKGNNGGGNGNDPPPPGGGNAGNDESDHGPGNPGRRDTAPGQNK